MAVLNLMGRVFMLPIDCPFRKADEILPEVRKETPIVLLPPTGEAAVHDARVAGHDVIGAETEPFGDAGAK